VQLEEGIKKQIDVTETSKQILEQRKMVWMEQNKKVKAVEMLLEKKRIQIQAARDKEEQTLADEFASQKYIRNKMLLAQQAG
jgi:flagellar FliJ protein